MSSIFRCDPRPVHRGEITGTNTASYRRVASIHGIHTRGLVQLVQMYLLICVCPPSLSEHGAAFPQPRDDATGRHVVAGHLTLLDFRGDVPKLLGSSFSLPVFPFSFFLFFFFLVQVTWWLGDCLG